MTMELRMNTNNNPGEGAPVTCSWPPNCKSAAAAASSTATVPRPKRDFHFKVIQVNQGPKWFIWPSRKKRTSSMCDDNSTQKTNESSSSNDTMNNNNTPSTDNSSRKPLNLQNTSNKQSVDLSIVEGQMTPVTASSQQDDSPSSEPTTRRLCTKCYKACTDPISASAPSSTFKILSISKKWDNNSLESDDDELGLENCIVVSSQRHLRSQSFLEGKTKSRFHVFSTSAPGP